MSFPVFLSVHHDNPGHVLIKEANSAGKYRLLKQRDKWLLL
jgi:hypothetical protein